MSLNTDQTSPSVPGTAIPMQSNAYGSGLIIRLVNVLDLLRQAGDNFAPTKALSANLPSSLKIFKNKSTSFRNFLSSLRCSAVDTPSMDTKEEDNTCTSFMPQASIRLGVMVTGN